MAQAQVEAVIRDILVREIGLPAERLADASADTPLLGRGIGLDSVEAMSLAAALEARFGIEIPDDQLDARLFRSLRTLVATVEERIAAQERNGGWRRR